MDLKKLIDKKAQAADYMVDEITYICKNLEKREPGSAGEKQAADYMAKQLKEYGCDTVYTESFEEHPRAFFGWLFITITCILIAVVAYFFYPVISVVLIAFGFLCAFMELGVYKHFVDFLFPKKTGHNVVGLKKPKGEVKRRIIFNGHTDAVWEWPVNYRFGGVAFESHSVICVLGALYYIILSFVYVVNKGFTFNEHWGSPYITAALCGLIFVPFLIGLYFMVNYRRIVDGANDNLSGCYIGLSVMKFLHDEGIELENTEVGVINTGSEEAGLRGSEAWAKKHRGEFDDVPTFIYSFDTIFDPKFLMVNYRDLNGLLKTDKDANDLFLESARELDLPCKKGWVPPFGGATDTIGFRRGGFRAGGITGLDHKLQNYYHTRRDTYDNMNKDGLANCYAITVRTLEKFDDGAKQ